jgi:glycosyltransferase involved in cell wall biosynthesis
MNNFDKKVSIIISSYNREDSIERSVESALNQTYKNIEVIVVDDGSTDTTVEILQKTFGDKIKLIVLEKNQGATNARNTGLKLAAGEYSIVWDSDDILYPNAVETLLKKAREFPEALTISSITKVFSGDQEVVYKPLSEGFVSREDVFCAVMPKYKLVRMSKTLAHQQKNILYKGKNLDFMVNDELVSAGSWYYLQTQLGDHFLLSDKNSLTISRRKLNAVSSINRADILYNHLKRFKEVYLNNCPRRYTDYAYGATLGFILKGENQKARELAQESWKICKNFRNFAVLVLSFLPFNSKILNFMYKMNFKFF